MENTFLKLMDQVFTFLLYIGGEEIDEKMNIDHIL